MIHKVQRNRIDRPVFVLGAARSGTTLFFNVLAFHPDFVWFSNYSHRYPDYPILALLSRVHDLPVIGRLVSKSSRYIPRPVESYQMLNYCTDSVFTSQRVLESSDLTQSSRNRYRQIVKDYLRIQGKIRFIQKHTGFARIYYLKSIFPDAMFIHVYRDGRAVANSLNKVHFWSNDLNGWCWGDMKRAYMHEYMQSGREPIVLAGIVWKTLMDLIEEECAELTAKQLLRIRYDELISDLPGTMRRVLSFCGLNYSRRFDNHVRGTRVLNMDTKWRKNLSTQEKRLLENCIGKHIIKYGFLL